MHSHAQGDGALRPRPLPPDVRAPGGTRRTLARFLAELAAQEVEAVERLLAEPVPEVHSILAARKLTAVRLPAGARASACLDLAHPSANRRDC